MTNILLIEDDQIVRENTEELLELNGFEVLTAPNGRLGIMKALSTHPDLIICDIMMPEVDGYGVLDALSQKEETKHIPFIFLSAKTEHKEVRKGMDLGADDYLTKPYEEEDLINAVRSRLAKAILTHESTSADGSPQNINELKNYFDDEGEIIEVRKGEILFNEGESSNKIFLLLKGVIKTHRLEESGKELTTALYKADDFLGFTSLSQNEPYSDTATAIEEAELAAISKADLKDILNSSQNLSLELMNLITSNLAEVKSQLLQMAYSSMRRKTASTILQFADILQKNEDNTITIGRYDLANVAGIAKESLIRTLSEFKKLNLIEITGRNIRIIDLKGLKEVL